MPPVYFSSNLFLPENRSNRVLAACNLFNCDSVLVGHGASKDAHDKILFKKQKINLLSVNCLESEECDKMYPDRITILYTIFKYGINKTKDLIDKVLCSYDKELKRIDCNF